MFKEIDPSYLLGSIINPISGYFLCRHYIATEINPSSKDYVPYKYSINIPYGINDLLTTNEYNKIKNYDILLVQVNYFDFFYDKILPSLGDKRIILITSQWAYPMLKQSKKTDDVLNSDNILLWIAQNPIYEESNKYMPFPFGINMNDLSMYYCCLSNFYANCDDEKKKCNISKRYNIQHMNCAVHNWYPEDHIRKLIPNFGVDSPSRLGYVEYLKNLSVSRYIISPQGDRPDCYRNYEAIGFGCKPISNLDDSYKCIFKDNMIFMNPEEMIQVLKTKNLKDYEWKLPDRRLILSTYWLDRVIFKIKAIM